MRTCGLSGISLRVCLKLVFGGEDFGGLRLYFDIYLIFKKV